MSKRPNLLKLVTKISLESMTYTGITYDDPEYKIFDPIVDDDMCEVMMHLRLEKGRSAQEVARRCHRDLDFVQEQLDKLWSVGAIRYYEENGEKMYYFTIWVPGIMEDILSKTEQCNQHPEIGYCFEEYTRKRIELLAPVMNNGTKGMMFMRTMPVMTSIENNTQAAPYDKLKTILDRATAISVGPCSCRRSRRLMGEGCGHLEDDMCMYLNENAVNMAKDGNHRLVSKEEALEILKRAEDNGLVHNVDQTPGFEDITAICNCCGCSCYALRVAEYFRSKDAIRSNFVARVDKEKCVACGMCVENCQTNALRLGQKNCITNPHISDAYDSDQSIPWDRSSYNEDYRTDRSDVMESGTAPCKATCPAHIPVQGYIKLAGEGRYQEALELIKHENPFPAVCGRICNKACESACTRGIIDASVAIDDIKKFIAEKDLDAKTRYVPKLLNQTGKPYPEKIAVIGAGPAGLSCAYYLAIKGYPVTVFEKEQIPGGMLTMGIPSFRLERDVVNAEIDILRELGVEFRCGVEVGKDVSLDDLRKDGYKAFFLGVGASKGSSVGCEGDNLKGVYTGIDFLRQVNLGKAPKIGNNVVVIGGGNVAIDVARTAVRLGAENVTVVYRRGRDEMPAAADEVAEAEAEGVKFMFLAAPVKIAGKDKCEKLKVEIMELGQPDAKGRKNVTGTGKFKDIEVTTVISAIGQKINIGSIGEFECNANGTVIVDAKTCQTSIPDVFAGGDVVTGPKFAIDAIAAGKEAYVSIHRYVHAGQTLLNGRDNRDYKPFDTSTVGLSIGSFDTAPRQSAKEVKASDATKTFKDLRGTLTEEQIKKEAERCLGCGCVVLDEGLCVGCGICTTKCKFDAIHLEKTMDTVGKPYFNTLLTAAGNAPAAIGRLIKKKLMK